MTHTESRLSTREYVGISITILNMEPTLELIELSQTELSITNFWLAYSTEISPIGRYGDTSDQCHKMAMAMATTAKGYNFVGINLPKATYTTIRAMRERRTNSKTLPWWR